MVNRKYYKNKQSACKACRARNESEHTHIYQVFRMPKGSRKAGWYAVCTFLEYVNTY